MVGHLLGCKFASPERSPSQTEPLWQVAGVVQRDLIVPTRGLDVPCSQEDGHPSVGAKWFFSMYSYRHLGVLFQRFYSCSANTPISFCHWKVPY